jgi:hypothetical protein
MTPPANQDIFLSFDTTWRIFKYKLGHPVSRWTDRSDEFLQETY